MTANPSNVIFDRDIEPAILDVLRGAREAVVLVSPFIKAWDGLRREVRAAYERGVKVVVVSKKGKHEAELDALQDEGAIVKLVKGLHAKAAINESTVIVMSMNLHAYSVRHAREIAVRLTSHEEMAEVRRYVVGLLGADQLRTRACIDCGVEIPYEPYRPRCEPCWAVRQNERDGVPPRADRMHAA